MGSGRMSPDDWGTYTTSKGYATKSTADIFDKRSLAASLNPKGVKFRESCDSVDNPLSTPIILGLDVTGSMGMIADTIARNGLPVLMKEIYDRKPITDPHVMFMGIGDLDFDAAPLQVSQFEADIRIAKQLEELFLEHGGGGNDCESYALAWYFAAMHTKIDSFIKRKKKGYLFTFGDELPTKLIRKSGLEAHLGDIVQTDQDVKDLLTLVSREWNVFHVIVEEGNFASSRQTQVLDAWQKILGQRVIPLADHTKLAEVVVSTLQVNEGADLASVVKSWNGSTALVVEKAVRDLATSKTDDVVKL